MGVYVFMQKAKCVQSWQYERDKNGKRKEEISELLPALKQSLKHM